MWADARGGAPPHCLLGNMSSTRPRRLAADGARTPTRQKESEKKEKSWERGEETLGCRCESEAGASLLAELALRVCPPTSSYKR